MPLKTWPLPQILKTDTGPHGPAPLPSASDRRQILQEATAGSPQRPTGRRKRRSRTNYHQKRQTAATGPTASQGTQKGATAAGKIRPAAPSSFPSSTTAAAACGHFPSGSCPLPSLPPALSRASVSCMARLTKAFSDSLRAAACCLKCSF